MRRTWVILLLIALLPWHGWAAASMAAPWASPGGLAGAVESAMPCHADPAHDDLASAQADSAPSSHLCKTCDLCHAALALPAHDGAGLSEAPSVAPPAAQPRDTGRLLAGSLERPPRT